MFSRLNKFVQWRIFAAIEVKSSVAESISGMREFKARYPRAKTYLVGGQGMPIDEFLTTSAREYLAP